VSDPDNARDVNPYTTPNTVSTDSAPSRFGASSILQKSLNLISSHRIVSFLVGALLIGAGALGFWFLTLAADFASNVRDEFEAAPGLGSYAVYYLSLAAMVATSIAGLVLAGIAGLSVAPSSNNSLERPR